MNTTTSHLAIVSTPDSVSYLLFIIVFITPKALTVTTFYTHITAGLATFCQSPVLERKKKNSLVDAESVSGRCDHL